MPHATRLLALLTLLVSHAAGQVVIHASLHPAGINGNSLPAMAAISDLDGDGIRDHGALVLAPSAAGGLAWALSLRSGINGAVIQQLPDLVPDGLVEPNIESAGDIDGDGLDEVLVSFRIQQMPSGVYGVGSSIGDVRLYSTATGGLLHQWLTVWPFLGGAFGASLMGIDDVDGDGVRDIVIGDSAVRVVAIYSGATGAFIRSLVPPTMGSDSFGSSLADVGDWNGDGAPDIAIGAPNPGTVVLPGQVYVFSATSGQVLATLSGLFQGSFPVPSGFGTAITPMGDLNGDGLVDLAVLEPAGGPLTNPDRVRMFAGGSGALLYNGGYSLPGAEFSFIESLVDVDGDGLSELALWGPTQPIFILSGSGSGVALGPFGIPDLLPGTYPPTPTTTFLRLRRFTDLDADGVPEFLLSRIGGGIAALAAFTVFSPPSASVTFLSTQVASGPQFPLGSGLPRLGSVLTLTLNGAPPARPGFLIAAPGPEVVFPLSPQVVIYPDLARLPEWVLFPMTTGPQGTWTQATALPLDTSLAGLDLVLQVYLPSPAPGLAGAEASSGLRLVLGF